MNNTPTGENPDSQALLNQIVLEFMREQNEKGDGAGLCVQSIFNFFVSLPTAYLACLKKTKA